MEDLSTKEILKKVRQVEIRSRRQVTESLVGAYHSVFKGTGMDFEEVREYAPGDDVRSIDWNVTAKMDKPFIKLYREERELTIMLLVDLSASGFFGSDTQSKRELAAELACVLAFSATRNNDKVGLILFSDRIEHFIYPKKGRQHVLRLIRDILFFEPQGTGTDIPMAIDYLNSILRKKAITFVISDFLTPDLPTKPTDQPPAWQDAFRKLAVSNRRHDVIAAELVDPRELELPDAGIITLEDAETGEQIEVDTSRKETRDAYRDHNQMLRTEIARAFRRGNIDHLKISTDEPYDRTLRTFFERRERRR